MHLGRILLPVLASYALCITAAAQDRSRDTTRTGSLRSTTSLAVLGGLGTGYGRLIGEVGFARTTSGINSTHAFANAVFISIEAFDYHGVIIAPKVGAWASGGVAPMALGANGLCYLGDGKALWYFRPEIGLGAGPLKLVYGWNLGISGKDDAAIPPQQFSLTLLFPVKTLRRTMSSPAFD